MVMETIRNQILEKLGAIEQEHHVRIPIAIESGSRAWGFSSPDSDYDCRFMYVCPKDAYLTILNKKDTLEYASDGVFDVGGWDIRKVIQHLVKSNAVMHEWLQSGVVYRKHAEVHGELWRLAQMYFNPISTGWHYLSMARNAYQQVCEGDFAKIKRYFYILRPLACVRFIRERKAIPFMEYRSNLSAISILKGVLAEIDELTAQKRTAEEGFMIPRKEALLAYFRDEMEQGEAWLNELPKKEPTATAHADACFRKMIEMVNADD